MKCNLNSQIPNAHLQVAASVRVVKSIRLLFLIVLIFCLISFAIFVQIYRIEIFQMAKSLEFVAETNESSNKFARDENFIYCVILNCVCLFERNFQKEWNVKHYHGNWKSSTCCSFELHVYACIANMEPTRNHSVRISNMKGCNANVFVADEKHIFYLNNRIVNTPQ